MTEYTTVKVNISQGQKDKLKHALKNKCAVSIRLNHSDLQDDDVLAITQSQAKKITRAYESGRGTTIKITQKQLKHNMKVEGGFLGMLAGLASSVLPTIVKTVLPALGVGTLSGLASSGVQKAMGNPKKGGCICKVETDGKGLYLGPMKKGGKLGDGLYLKKGGKFYDGKGLLLGPNSPFANIPILGAIL